MGAKKVTYVLLYWTCNICGKEKYIREFCGDSKSASGHTKPCRKCHTKNNKKHNKKYQETGYFRNHHLKKTFGITLEDFNRKLQTQNGLCAICFKLQPDGKNLAVDHDHSTSVVRDLLCNNCNVVIGLVEEDILRLTAIIAYLKKHKGDAANGTHNT